MSLSSDLTAIKNLSDGVKNNKVTRFAYTQQAYTNNSVDGHADYDPTRGNNIPTADLSVIEVNPTVVDKGFRARASSLPRMLLNHLFGRISYNLNKVNDLFNELLVKVMANMGVANGLATLDANGRIPYSQLPEDAMEYQGEWNAQTNTPHLADGTGTRGDTYNVSVAGTQNLGSGSITFFVGDRVIYNENGVWQRLASGSVQSVCEILPDQNNGNVDLTQQADVTKILNSDFVYKLLGCFNGRVWHKGSGITSATFYSPTYANGLWVAGSSTGLYWSEDGKAWTRITTISSNRVYSPVYANGLWVAGGSYYSSYEHRDYGYIYWSEDGKNWTRSYNATHTVRAPKYANGLWVVGTGVGILWSENGKDWVSSDYTSSTGDVSYANGLWFASVYSVGLMWSGNGKNWTACTGFPSNTNINAPIYANGTWVANNSWKSTDGKAWTQAQSTYTMYLPIYVEGIWIAGSSHGLLWSANLTSWNQISGTENFTIQTPIYADGVFVTGGGTGSAVGDTGQGCWYSIDGRQWYRATGENSNYIMYAPSYANKQLVAGSGNYLCWANTVSDYLNGVA